MPISVEEWDRLRVWLRNAHEFGHDAVRATQANDDLAWACAEKAAHYGHKALGLVSEICTRFSDPASPQNHL